MIWCLAWVLVRAPLPVCHAHAGEVHRAETAGLDLHLKGHHPDSGVVAWFDWHIHWLSPWEVSRGELPGNDPVPSSDSRLPTDDTGGVFVSLNSVCLPATGARFDRCGGFEWVVPERADFWIQKSGGAGSFLGAHRNPERVRALTCVALC